MRDKPRPKALNNDIILPILEAKPFSKALQILGFVFIIGFAGVIVAMFFPNGPTKSTILICCAPFVAIPLFIYMVSSPDNTAGVIRFTDNEILVKRRGKMPMVFAASAITALNYDVKDYEGEDRLEDILTPSGRMKVRTGENNYVNWVSNGDYYSFQFKLGNEFQFKRAIHFLELLKIAVENKNSSLWDTIG